MSRKQRPAATRPRVTESSRGSTDRPVGRALEWAVVRLNTRSPTSRSSRRGRWPTSFGWSFIPDGYDPARDLATTLEPIIASLKRTHPDVVIVSKIVEGHPAPVLIHESVGADLLVVGSRGHGEFVGMLIGSTSEHCVANAACPVVVIRSRP